MKKVKNLKKVDIHFDEKLWKAGEVLEISDRQWASLEGDEGFLLVLEVSAEVKQKTK